MSQDSGKKPTDAPSCPPEDVDLCSDKRAIFVREYLIDSNSTRAAIAAGYSKKTAKSQGSRLLTFVDVQEAIKASLEPRLEALDITADRIMREAAKMAFEAPSDPMKASDKLKALELLGRHLGVFAEDNKHINPTAGFDPAKFFADLFRKPEAG